MQRGFAVWLTGLPSSGKTTLAYALRDRLLERGLSVQMLDSDELRGRLTPHPTYSPEERDWFYDVLVFLAGMLTDNGVNVLLAATASKQSYRAAARNRIQRFAEVYVECSLDVCRERDRKGLWDQADRGMITALPGHGTPYEPPESPEAHVDTVMLAPEAAAQEILRQLDEEGFFSDPSEGI
ncbi:MAG TPA: adenylyl-sulfate kinase [Sediminispirochaeta sp.]|nr:adenylyl-sulfate kinase [Sediminispirochaeta sp.]